MPHHFYFGAVAAGVSTAPSIVQVASFGNSGSDTSVAVSISGFASSESRLVALVTARDTSTPYVTSISQTGMTWTRITHANNGDISAELWYSSVTSGTPGTTVTANLDGNDSNRAIIVTEIAGLTTNDAQLVLSSGSNTGGSPTQMGIGTISGIDNHFVILGGQSKDTAAGYVGTDGFTVSGIEDDGTRTGVQAWASNLTSIDYNPTISGTISQNWSAVGVVLKGA